ncbi:MAG TPA: PHP domain-containing protein [Candidatus Baltobacteraceae bacterium]
MIVDFHSHTCESDGTLVPQALADFMAERKVEVYSISDHDSLAAYGKFDPGAGARVVTGIEINTTWQDNEVHVLGYRLPLDDAAFNDLVARNRDARRIRIGQVVDKLRATGYGITMADVERECANDAALGRPHVAKALIRLGAFSDVDAVFRTLLTRGKPAYVPSIHISPAQAIDAIHAAGGVAVLAHPGRLRTPLLIDELAQQLDGLEVFYPRHDADDIARFRALAATYGLAMTAGADFHDIRYNARGVGMEVEPEDVRAFLDLIGA